MGAAVLFFGILNFLTVFVVIVTGAKSYNEADILYWLIRLDLKKRLQLAFMIQTGVSFIFLGLALIILI